MPSKSFDKSMDFSAFDEFGNPVGAGPSESEVESDQQYSEASDSEQGNYEPFIPEEQQHYPLAEQVFPEHTTVMHEAEDRQQFTEPIIKPEKRRKIAADISDKVQPIYDSTFMVDLFKHEESIRNIAVVGAFGHGKTEFVDMFVKETHPSVVEKLVTNKDVTNEILGHGRRLDRLGWTDRLLLEKHRMLSVSTEVMSLISEDLNGKSWAFNIIDTPGHPDFLDQVNVGLAMADGVLFCIDCVEGLTEVGRRLLETVVRSGLKIALVITKLDRLILEMKLPPDFAFTKLRRVIEEVNTVLRQNEYDERLSPELFNVAFTSSQFNLCFTAESIGLMYNRKPVTKYKFDREHQMNVQSKVPDGRSFGMRLWGNYRFDGETRQIIQSTDTDLPHPFVLFVMEPLYKVFTHVISREPEEWSKLLRIPLTAAQKKMNTIPLLRIALSRVFGNCGSLTTLIADKLPSPIDKSMRETGLVALAAKFVPAMDGETIYALIRVFRGELSNGIPVVALSNSFEEDRDAFKAGLMLGDLAISHVRYSTPVASAGPGMIVKAVFNEPVPGICSLVSPDDVPEPVCRKIPIPEAHVRLSIEPLDHSKYQEMLASIAKAKLCYPSLSGTDQALLGTGELFMDCVMHDLRNTFADIEIKVSDPFVVFNETVSKRSVTICHAKIGGQGSIGIIAEPMNQATRFYLESGQLVGDFSEMLVRNGWDEMAAESVWAFGPDSITGPNILIDDTLHPKPVFTQAAKSSIKRSFEWSCNSGPLCEEMLRGVVFRIADANLGTAEIMPAELMDAVRKAMFASVLAAQPSVCEPIYAVEILTPQKGLDICEEVIRKRRGTLIDEPKPVQGTQLFSMRAEVPLIDMFGMEVDIRRLTAGLAFPLSYFSRWELVPGDPLDASAMLKPLEPSPDHALARDFVVKTRRKRGLSDDIDISKYFDISQELIEIASLS